MVSSRTNGKQALCLTVESQGETSPCCKTCFVAVRLGVWVMKMSSLTSSAELSTCSKSDILIIKTLWMCLELSLDSLL